jgi:hypothetical protein
VDLWSVGLVERTGRGEVIAMNTTRNSYDAGREARHDRQAHPEATAHHDGAMQRYLAGLAYAEAHDHAEAEKKDQRPASPTTPDR